MVPANCKVTGWKYSVLLGHIDAPSFQYKLQEWIRTLQSMLIKLFVRRPCATK